MFFGLGNWMAKRAAHMALERSFATVLPHSMAGRAATFAIAAGTTLTAAAGMISGAGILAGFALLGTVVAGGAAYMAFQLATGEAAARPMLPQMPARGAPAAEKAPERAQSWVAQVGRSAPETGSHVERLQREASPDSSIFL